MRQSLLIAALFTVVALTTGCKKEVSAEVLSTRTVTESESCTKSSSYNSRTKRTDTVRGRREVTYRVENTKVTYDDGTQRTYDRRTATNRTTCR